MTSSSTPPTTPTPCDNHDLCQARALKAARQLCRDKGLRFTSLRRRVLELIWEQHTPVKAYDLLPKLQPRGKAGLSKAGLSKVPAPPTVYRALQFLLHHGLVHQLKSQRAYAGCAHPQAHHHCFFLICTHCGTVDEACPPGLTKSLHQVAHSHAFTLQGVTLEIEGLCQSCAVSKAA